MAEHVVHLIEAFLAVGGFSLERAWDLSAIVSSERISQIATHPNKHPNSKQIALANAAP